ncbi:MAG: DUF4124 domain-containing protein [Porticoccaceae bacterium]
MTIISHKKNAALAFLCSAVLTFSIGSQAAETVYKYRNEKGAITYSDTPPRHASDYEQVTLPGYAPGDPERHEATLEQITATSDRLQADRLKREEDREKLLPAATTTHYSAPAPEREVYLIPGYPYHHHRPHPQRPQPPYRIDTPRDTLDAKLRTPIPMPSFGSGESLRDR